MKVYDIIYLKLAPYVAVDVVPRLRRYHIGTAKEKKWFFPIEYFASFTDALAFR